MLLPRVLPEPLGVLPAVALGVLPAVALGVLPVILMLLLLPGWGVLLLIP